MAKVISCNLKSEQNISIKFCLDHEGRTLECDVITHENALKLEAKLNYAIVLISIRVDDKPRRKENNSNL